MRTSRRILLKSLAAGLATAAISRREAAATGTLATWQPAAGFGALGPRKVLEVFMRGGASMWGAFWYDPTEGTKTGDTSLSQLEWEEIRGVTGMPPVLPFSSGWLGRAAAPVKRTSGVRSLSQHMKVIRVRHELLPHEAAIPYTITGTTLGRPHQAGLGAAIWRRAHEQTGAGGIQALILQTGSQSGDNLAARYASATGNHGPEYCPPIITLGDPAFYDALPRTGLTATDSLKAFYRDRYEDRLRFQPTNALVRSDGWSAYRASLDTMMSHHAALYNLLAPYSLDLFPDLSTYTPDYHSQSLPRSAIQAAVDMLTTTDLRYAGVIDGGVETDYDTHKALSPHSVPFVQNGNVWSTLDALADNLDTILDSGITVLLHAEFGRIESGGNTGTEHHMRGYTNVVISDLITSPGFVGDIDAANTTYASYSLGARGSLSPTDVRAAVAQLAGIEPWQNDIHLNDVDLACRGSVNVASELLGVS